jgi:hypothetical protein
MLDKLDRFKRLQVTPQELMGHPSAAAQSLLDVLGGPFDVVASACVITQMQLSVLNALGDRHQLFRAVQHTVSVTHLRSLSRLTRVGGRCLFVTDLVSTDRLNHDGAPTGEAPQALYERALKEGNLIYVAHPELFLVALRRPTCSHVSISRVCRYIGLSCITGIYGNNRQQLQHWVGVGVRVRVKEGVCIQRIRTVSNF